MIYKKEALLLRPVLIDDAKILFQWRNDKATRRASHSSHKILWDEHIKWLTLSLNNNNKNLFLAEENGIAVGTVRTDYTDNSYKLSWTVAPEARGKGIGKKMVNLLISNINEPVHAEIKKGNKNSSRIAEHSGMKLIREDDELLYYLRDGINQKHHS